MTFFESRHRHSPIAQGLAVALVAACAVACATTESPPAASSTEPSDAGAADPAMTTPETPDAARADASERDASSTKSDASAQVSACEGAALACDPLADTGCPAGQHCMVIVEKTQKRVVCQAAGTTEPLGSPGGIKDDCTKNPCTAGNACFAALGVCIRVCDPTVGTQPLPGHAGRAASPACATAYGKDCNAGVTGGVTTCFGLCDTVGYSPGG